MRELYERFQSNFSELSLKTIWFILRERLNPPKNKDSKKNPYKDEIAQYLFCGSIQDLSRLHPLRAEIEEIQDAMEAVLQDQEDDARLKYWLQLDLIFKAAVKAGILDRNPVQYIIASVSKRATDRQREIRNAMTKKNLETDEENRLLELLSAPTQNPQNEQSELPLYVINSKALLLAVRFFTGLTATSKTKDGKRFYKISVSRGHGLTAYTERWYIPDGVTSKRAIEKALRDEVNKFEIACGNGEVLSRAEKKEKAAQEAAEAAEAARKAAEEAAKIKTVRQYATDVFMPAKEATLSENARASYQMFIDRHILPVLGDIALAEVKPAMITKLILDFQKAGYAHASAVKLYNVLRFGFFPYE